ncbi:MAG: SGNH/GDSL hydrolase family protein [Acidobacteriia bacterium]|nr:SGNH/GDSL hydrolase family protein [Terriglobia bacterium]
MIWTKVKEVYGLRPPFNFRIAIPFLLNFCSLVVLILACIYMIWHDDVNIETARFYFFLYIACLLAVATVVSRAATLSYLIFAWCAIELCLATGSVIVASNGARPSLFPEDDPVQTGVESVMYHPLLQIVPHPSVNYERRLFFGGLTNKAKAAGIDVQGLRGTKLKFEHNSLGLRGKELTADDLAKDLIFVYGGSTTYDITVTQGETWAEHLQSDLNNKYTVVNFGVIGHSTVEHLIQTAFYQDVIRKKPVCAVYYVGWNDIGSSHIENLDSAYANYHLLLLPVHRPGLSLAKYSPLALLANALAVKRFDTIPLPPKLLGKPPVSGPDEHLEAVFIDHIKSIAAINKARGIKTVFIGQILNRRWSDGPNQYEPMVKEGENVPLMERLKSTLSTTADSIGAKYIDPGVQNFDGSDFVDGGHFAAAGTRKFAKLVAGGIGDYCR